MKAQGPPLNPSKTISRILVLAIFTVTLSACGIDPFVDGRREAGSTKYVGPSTPNRVAICYNSRTVSPKDVLALAEAECAKTNRVPRLDGQEKLTCSFFNPSRVYFKCVPPPS